MYAVIKAVLEINEQLTIGSVRLPLASVTEEDKPIIKEAAEMIRHAKKQFC